MFGKAELFIIFHTKLKTHCISFLTACPAPIFQKKTKKKKPKKTLIMYCGVYSFTYVEIKLSEHRIKDKMGKIRVYCFKFLTLCEVV